MTDTKIATIKQGLMRRITLYPDRIERGRKSYPLAGVCADVSASGGSLTGTRFLTISGPEFSWTQRSDALFEGKCRKFAARVNAQVAAVTAQRTS